MIFVPKIVDNYNIKRHDVDGIGRHYLIELEDGTKKLYPSMTTLLSLTKSKEMEDILNKWRKSVGKKRAYAISTIATDSGTLLHEFCEYVMLRDNVKAQNLYKTCTDSRAKFYMKKIAPYLQKYKYIYASEEFMFTHKHRVAGTTDAIVFHNNKPYVLDFKTSKSIKDPKEIEDYYIQVSGYALMWEEITGQVINDGIILIVNPYNVQEIIVDLREYKQKFIEKVNEFYNKFGDEYLQKVLDIS